jgi:YebC/PmpR family DNA-binding regulatory protein
MGRAFEYRKARKLKRWGNMAKIFTKLGREITIAAKDGGPDPEANPRLRMLIQNAKAANMPKDNVERAIKRATEKDHSDYKEVIYEGYGPFGVAVLVETATNNTTRTVANVRSYFNKTGGSLGTSGSVSFMFEHKCHFKVKAKEGTDLEELELELIDHGVSDIFEEDDNIVIYGDFES